MKLNKAISPASTQNHSRIAFIQACWHQEIVDRSRDAFVSHIATLGHRDVDVFEVPGVFEIPLHARRLARSGKYDAIVAAGLIVDGGIYRHEFVSQAVISGLMQVQLEDDTPVFSVALTPHQFHGSPEHVAFFSEHFEVKGVEAANACAATLASLTAICA